MAELITLGILFALIPVICWAEEKKKRQKDNLKSERLRKMQ